MYLRALVCLAVGAAMAVPGSAAVTININSTGSRVVANAFGTLDISGMVRFGGTFSGAGARVNPSTGTIVFNTGPTGQYFAYDGFSGPVFGTGDLTFATSSTGTPLSLNASIGRIFVETSFGLSGPVRSRNIWDNASLASLGMTPGTYVLTLPNDRITINIGGSTVVPEPAAWALLIAGFGLVGAALRRNRSSPARCAGPRTTA